MPFSAKSDISLGRFPTEYWRYLLATALFGIGNSSNSFLILRTQDIGVIFLIAYLGFALTQNILMIAGLFVFYGLYQGIFRAVGKAFASDFVPNELRASAVGWYSTSVGLLELVASVVAGMNGIEQKRGQERPEKSAGIVADALEAKGPASVFFVNGGRDQGIARSGTGASAHPIKQPCAEQRRPDRREPHQGLGDRRQKIAEDGNGFASLQLVGKRAGKSLHDVLRGLREAVDKTDNAAACLQGLCQENQ